MSLFYAYAKHAHDDWSGRFLIVFATRAVADEWWRAVSTSSVSRFPASIRRITPHFYTHDPGRAHIADTLKTSKVATQFVGRVFMTLLDDRGGRQMHPIPSSLTTDHISGNWFYIRSKRNNSIYWYLQNGRIVASQIQCTRFRITAVDKSLRGAVLIGKDQVYVTLSGDISLKVSNNGLLQGERKAEAIRFGDFIDGFRLNAYGNEVLSDVPSNAIVTTRENDAQEWELSESGLLGGFD